MKYTRGRRPCALVWHEPATDRAEASRREYAVKRLSRATKLAMVEAHSPGDSTTPSGTG